MNLNYAPLKEPVTQEDVRTYEASRNERSNALNKLLIGVGSAALLYVILMTVVSGKIGPQMMAPFVLGCIVVGIYVLNRLRKRKLARLYKFAMANNLRFIADVQNPTLNGVIFEVGHSRRIDEALILPNGTEIGGYQYSVGSGRNRRTYRWGYMRVKLARNVPNMLLDSKKNNFLGGRFSNLPRSYTKDQTIKLEGNFNDYFTLYAPVDYSKDAYYIFTPDVMAALIDHGSDFDIEVIDNYLMFYRSQPINLESEQEIDEMLAVLDKVSSELIDQADYYTDERVAYRAADVIAEPGRRLKKKLPTLALVIIVLVFLAFIVNPLIGFIIQIMRM